jgi:hypothetical protein
MGGSLFYEIKTYLSQRGKKAGGMAQALECLPSKREVPSSNLSTPVGKNSWVHWYGPVIPAV